MVTRVTPLLRFLRCLDSDQKKAFAEQVGTTLVYLYQLADSERPNPTLQLAQALVLESKRIHRKVMAFPLTYEDLLIGAPPKEASTSVEPKSTKSAPR